MFLGFFHPLANRSIVPFILSVLVSFLLAVTIHSTYSFLLVKESKSNVAASFLFFFNDTARSSGSLTSLVLGSTQLNISLVFGLASFFLSASVFARNPKTDQVSSKEIKLIQVSLSPSLNRQSQPLSRVRSVCTLD